MHLTANDLAVGERDGGPVECPACGYMGGGFIGTDEQEGGVVCLRLYCDHGHIWRIVLDRIDDSISTFVYRVEVESEGSPEWESLYE